MNFLFVGLIISLSVEVHSDNGLFRASINYAGGAELITESFALHDQHGDIIYTKRDVPVNTFFISNTGCVFALNEHRLYFYQRDGGGMLLKELAFPNGFGFSPDNTIFFSSDRDGIFAYSHDGVLVHTYRPGRMFASTANGELVVVISADTLFAYENGYLSGTEFLSSPYAHEVHFSDDAKSIVVQIQGGTETYDIENYTRVKSK